MRGNILKRNNNHRIIIMMIKTSPTFHTHLRTESRSRHRVWWELKDLNWHTLRSLITSLQCLLCCVCPGTLCEHGVVTSGSLFRSRCWRSCRSWIWPRTSWATRGSRTSGPLWWWTAHCCSLAWPRPTSRVKVRHPSTRCITSHEGEFFSYDHFINMRPEK